MHDDAGRILVIEDNPFNLELATALLESAGFDIVQATTAEIGLARALVNAPDLVLLDIRLPGMDGFAALRAMKAQSTLRDIPVVALSALSAKDDIEAAMAAGFDGYITKPINTRTFAESVVAYLRPKGEARRRVGA